MLRSLKILAASLGLSATLSAQTVLFGSFDPATVPLESLASDTALHISESNLFAESLTAKPHWGALAPFTAAASGQVGVVTVPLNFNTTELDLHLYQINTLQFGRGGVTVDVTLLGERAGSMGSVIGNRGLLSADFSSLAINLVAGTQYGVGVSLRTAGNPFSAQLAYWLFGTNGVPFSTLIIADNSPFGASTPSNQLESPDEILGAVGNPGLFIASVPEPAHVALGAGALCIGVMLLRRRRSI
jgi:hypothetical protein